MTERLAWLDGKTLPANTNAFGLIAQIERWLRTLKVDRAKILAMREEAMSGDNAHLLATLTAATGVEFTPDDEDDWY